MSSIRVLRGIVLQGQPCALPMPEAVRPAEPVVSAGPSVTDLLQAEFARGQEAGRTEAREALELERAVERDAAQRQLVQDRAEAREAGHRAGAEAAAKDNANLQERTRAEQQAAWDEKASVLDAVAASLASAVRKHVDSLEDDIVALCHAAIARFVGEVAATPEGVRGTVREALRELDGRPVTIALHPDDLALLDTGRDELASGIRWEADASIATGGVRIRGEIENLDATLETQFAVLKKTLLATRAARKRGDAV